MTKPLFPERLMPGDKVGLVSPSNSIAMRKDEFDKAVRNFEAAFEVEIQIAPHAMGKHYYASGTIDERVEDFMQMVIDPEIKLILCSTGGDIALDLLVRLDYEEIQRNPKIITGISDITTILNAITAQTGLVTFVGTEFMGFGTESIDYSINYMKKAWQEGDMGTINPNSNWKDFRNTPTEYKYWRKIREGKVSGTLVGGNFSSYFQLLHTPYSMNLEGSILLFETYKYAKKQIHKALSQLKLHGILEQIGGMLVGYCVGSDNLDVEGNNRDLAEVFLEVTEGYEFPIMQIGEFGHYVENAIMPIGAQATLNATELRLTIDEPTVMISD